MQNPHDTLLTRPLAENVALAALNDEALAHVSAERLLSLSLEEMRSVQAHYRSLGREPTDVELETIAQTWSEHCKHKTFKGVIDYVEKGHNRMARKTYDDLLKKTIARATAELARPSCLSVFEDNAGVVAFDGDWGVAFKVETHNHPSALEPYGGAGTGIGGVIRDILGVGLGARPFANTDVFCVGDFAAPLDPDAGILPPRRVLAGVIAGVRDYGNRMGIPTVNGAVLFHPGYLANPLVFAGTLGLIPRDKVGKRVSPGELIVALGGRTGRDGIHGATFSSLALEKGISASVVQIGNAIMEKKAMDVLLKARDQGLYRAVTDCGAGGFSSAVGELAAECGADVRLEQAPLKYEGLLPWEIWVSESQERMVVSLPAENLEAFQALCRVEDVECCVLGRFTDSGRLRVFYREELVLDLDLDFLHGGIPRVKMSAVWNEPLEEPAQVAVEPRDFARNFKKLLAHPDIGSKEWVVRQYDHEVQGGSVIKPLVGPAQIGPSDAAVLRPLLDRWRGVAVANGVNPRYGLIDPYWMAANAIEEALRNLTAVGAGTEDAAILDNFCWGDVRDPEILGGLVRASEACYDFAKAFGVPFISGKDSLNNTWRGKDGRVFSIPGTLLISAVSVVEDVRRCLTMDLKRPGAWVLLAGESKEEFGGSHWHEVTGIAGGTVPRVDAQKSKRLMRAIHESARRGLISACHDVSEGGAAVALAEMCIAGGLGAQARFPGWNPSAELFAESSGRWLLEAEPRNLSRLQKIFSGLPLTLLGKTRKQPEMRIACGKKDVLRMKVPEMSKIWRSFSNAQ